MLLGTEDYPQDMWGLSLRSANKNHRNTFFISVEDLVNDPSVRGVEPKLRECRFPDELLPGSHQKAYSFATCVVDCFIEFQMRLCNCSSFLLLSEGKNGIWLKSFIMIYYKFSK